MLLGYFDIWQDCKLNTKSLPLKLSKS